MHEPGRSGHTEGMDENTDTQTSQPVDYKALLEKYIEHVGECEGVDFIGDQWRRISAFTDEEWAALRELS